MRHIQSLLYRSLRHRLGQHEALAPLAKRYSIGAAAAKVVDAAVGDIYGEVRKHNLLLTLSCLETVSGFQMSEPAPAGVRCCQRASRMH